MAVYIEKKHIDSVEEEKDLAIIFQQDLKFSHNNFSK